MLATTASARAAVGEKLYFDRAQFEADLKRIVAFYIDRGYPDARVTVVRREAERRSAESVDITIDIEEGEPIRVERGRARRVRPACPRITAGQLRRRAAAAAGAAARPRAAAGEPRSCARGAPRSRLSRRRRSRSPRPRARRAPARRHLHRPARADRAYVGPIEITGISSVNERIVRRQLTFRPGELFQAEQAAREPAQALFARALQLRQRRAMTGADDTAVQGARRTDSGSRDRHRGQAPQGELRRRLRQRGEGPRRRSTGGT